MRVKWPRHLTPSHLSQFMRRQKNPLTALAIFRQSKIRYPNYSHNGLVYDTLINILGASGHVEKVKEVIDAMKEDSCECRDSSFASAINFYADAGFLDLSLALFRDIPEFNCVKWTNSLNAILRILLREKRPEDMYEVLMESSCRGEVKSWTESLNLVIGFLCDRNCSALGLSVLQEMIHHCLNPDRDTYHLLMKGLCREGKVEDAIHLLYSMFRRISRKGGGEDVVVYRVILNALCDKGRVKESVSLLEKILRKGLRSPKRYRRQYDLTEIAECVDAQKAKLLITKALIHFGVPSVRSYVEITNSLWTEGDLTNGNHALDVMVKKGFIPPASLYEAKVSALCRRGMMKEAMAVVDEELHYPSVGVYNMLMKGLCCHGKSLWAYRYFRKMVVPPNGDTYKLLVHGLCVQGKFAEGYNVMEDMMMKSCRPDARMMSCLIEGMCSSGQRYEALMLLEEMVAMSMVPGYTVWKALVSGSSSHFLGTPSALVFDLLTQSRSTASILII